MPPSAAFASADYSPAHRGDGGATNAITIESTGFQLLTVPHFMCFMPAKQRLHQRSRLFTATLNGFSALITLETIPAILQAQSKNAICFGVIIAGINIPIDSFNFS